MPPPQVLLFSHLLPLFIEEFSAAKMTLDKNTELAIFSLSRQQG
jgi:hypothetical protein